MILEARRLAFTRGALGAGASNFGGGWEAVGEVNVAVNTVASCGGLCVESSHHHSGERTKEKR